MDFTHQDDDRPIEEGRTLQSKPTKSTGGGPPIPMGSDPTRGAYDTRSFTDHAGNTGVSAFWGRAPAHGKRILPPLWRFQFYMTIDVPESRRANLAREILETIHDDEDYVELLRFDFHFLHNAGVEACMDHYRKHRTREERGGIPFDLPLRSHLFGRGSFFVVLDREDWREEGVTTVDFDIVPDGSDYHPPDPCLHRGCSMKRRRLFTEPVVSDEHPGPYLASILGFCRGYGSMNQSEELYADAIERGQSDWHDESGQAEMDGQAKRTRLSSWPYAML